MQALGGGRCRCWVGAEGPCPSCGVALPRTFSASPEEPRTLLLAREGRTVPWFLCGIELHRTEIRLLAACI